MALSANTRTRVAGKYTSMMWDDGSGPVTIAFCQNMTVTSQPAVAAATPIQPMNAPYPVEIVTAGAATNGTINLTLYELYGQAVWAQFASITNSQNIVDILTTIAGLNSGNIIGSINIYRVITPPPAIAAQTDPNGALAYHEVYYGCVINSITDDETVDVTTMFVPKQIQLYYTNSFKTYQSSNGLGFNDGSLGTSIPQ